LNEFFFRFNRRNFIKVFPIDYKRVLAAKQVAAVESIDESINDSERVA
jgi:hypothetical protein